MKRLALPLLVAAALTCGAGVATALREKPKFAESGYHAVLVQGARTLSDRGVGDKYWHARAVNEALVELVQKGLAPMQVTALDDDTVLILCERSGR